MNYFDDNKVNIQALKKKAYNFRWAEVADNIIPLSTADPDYPCAPEIVKAIQDYISDGYFSYTPKTGYDEFKKAFSSYVKRRKNENIDPELVVPIDSAARAMDIIAKAFLKPGDEMIVFDPCDLLFREACIQSGATPIFYPCKMDSEKKEINISDLEDYITDKTKMIGLCNPHNPFGLLYTVEQLDFIMRLCEKYNLYIMNDEIWSDIIYSDGKFNSVYCLGNDRCKNVLSVFGYSKSFGLAGLRVGNIFCTDKDNFNKVVEKSQVLSTVGGAASISMVAAAAAMNDSEYYLDAFVKHLEENRNYAVDFINQLPMLKAYRPKATYLLYIDIKETGMTGIEFTEYLKKTVGLAVIQGGKQFFGDQSEGHIRICFATSREILEEGLNRLKKGVMALAERKINNE